METKYKPTDFKLDKEGGGSVDFDTDDVIPKISNRDILSLFNKKRSKKGLKAKSVSLRFKLPRKGRIIRVFGSNYGEEDLEENVKLYELHLKQNKFFVVK